MYCLWCKNVTETINEKEGTTEKGRHFLKGNCKICNELKFKKLKTYERQPRTKFLI